MTPHRQLLADYVEKDSQEAFHELVTLYIGMVHSSSVRLVNGDVHRAQDIVQTVFADLAKHAHTVSTEATLGGWLHRRTCHVASNMMRTERRRQNREREAVEMNALHENPDETLAKIGPVLDEAINELNAHDRDAIMLRFFERCDLRTIGEVLGSNEDAAQKRIARALEKLRILLVRRGIALSATALALALGSNTASAAPVGLATLISTTALTTTKTGSGLTATTLKIMAMTKLKMTAIAAVTTLVLAGAGTTFIVLNRDKPYEPIGKPEPQKILQEAQADTTAGRYKEALAKHIWFQDNALKYEPSLVGVRSSFALTYFGELAKKYPPAMKKLKSSQDKAGKTVRNDNVNVKEGRAAFSEFSAINRTLGEEAKTTECFIWLDSHNPGLAKSSYIFAEPLLIKAGEYKLCGKYIDPETSYSTALRSYQAMKKSLQSTPREGLQGYAEKLFSERIATFVALLSLNDRQADAERVAAKATKELNDPAMIALLKEAKNGVIPSL